MKKPSYSEFIQAAISEARKLREALTQEEKDRLDIPTLAEEDPRNCIYGQATGNCYDERASELIDKCARKIWDNCGDTHREAEVSPCRGTDISRYHTDLELYICQPGAENEILIKYLKGEINFLML